MNLSLQSLFFGFRPNKLFSMKQTNNAIKFLMAQYRAIFKNAYFKGMASAVLLTAGLAVAGNAQAADYDHTSFPTIGNEGVTWNSGSDTIKITDAAAADGIVTNSNAFDMETINGNGGVPLLKGVVDFPP